jgi:hypothetical protein
LAPLRKASFHEGVPFSFFEEKDFHETQQHFKKRIVHIASLKSEIAFLNEQTTSDCELDKHLRANGLSCILEASLALECSLKFTQLANI